MPLSALARPASATLAPQFDPVINLLSAFVDGVDFEQDWLPPSDGRRARQIVDLLADHLTTLGGEVPPAERVEPPPIPVAEQPWADAYPATLPWRGPRVRVNPHAGRRLKLPAEGFWRELLARRARAGLSPLLVAGGRTRSGRERYVSPSRRATCCQRYRSRDWSPRMASAGWA